MHVETRLCQFYDRWLTNQRLPKYSADELVYELMVTRDQTINEVRKAELTYQIKWLEKFIVIWNNYL